MIVSLEAAVGGSVPRETTDKLEAYVAMLSEEATRQNLISRASLADVWIRHVADSAQLIRFEPQPDSRWVDIGSGAGLPGIVIACLTAGHVTLVEPRKLRADFLHRMCESLALNAAVVCSSAERLTGEFNVITARAVAPLTKLFEISKHLSTRKTVWVLPKGRTAEAELVEARRRWHGVFHVERSVTDADSYIIVGRQLRAKA